MVQRLVYLQANNLKNAAIPCYIRPGGVFLYSKLLNSGAVRSVNPNGKWGDYETCLTSEQAIASGDCVYRVVQWYDDENDRWFEFITNDFDLKPQEIAMLYCDRGRLSCFSKR